MDQTAFALDAAVRLLDFYEEYFDIPYPLPKQGQWRCGLEAAAAAAGLGSMSDLGSG